MAAAKKKRRRKPTPYLRHLRRHERRLADPVFRKWNRWSHDLDTILHQLVRNPALANADPKDIIARAEAFADAYEEMQARRRPPSVPDDY